MYCNIYNHIKTKYYDELKTLSVPIRQSVMFKYFVEEIPIFIKDDDYIAGWHGYKEVPFGEEKTVQFPFVSVMDDSERRIHERFKDDLKIEIEFHPAHTCIDYKKIIEHGLSFYIKKVDNALKADSSNEYLQAMKISLEAVLIFAKRYAEIALFRAENADMDEEKNHFLDIYNAVSNVPINPARNFLEGVQAVWIMHALLPAAEMLWASISIGRIDQYLYPLYQKEKDKKKAENILKNLFILLDSYGDGACAMNIGGMDEYGNDMMNELSELLIDVEKKMKLRAPIFAVRINPKTPDRIMDKVIDFELFKIGQPTFYGELPARMAIESRGISPEEACDFSANSCMGLTLQGREFSDMWAIKFNSHLPLELAVNNGVPLNTVLPTVLSAIPKEINNTDELIEQFGIYFKELMDISMNLYNLVAIEAETNIPDPFLSALTEGCVENKNDRATGAKYNTITIETMGLINTCDAITAISELVFEKKRYTLQEIVNAAKANYEGYEYIRRDLQSCSKYGENDSRVNSLCRKICDMVAEICIRKNTSQIKYMPSLHTIDGNVFYGEGLYATLDGRKQGEPVNKNANPSNQLKKLVPTSVVMSATAINQTLFSGGQPIDIFFDKTWFSTKEMRDKIKNFILMYFELGGLQFQVNSIETELLEKAHKEPEKYPQVIIRKGGYSVRFNELEENVREEFIELSKKNCNL